ncbi:MAG TPA: M20/M25/M40 family metallo-hydrolase [Candidatus Saccharimonadales bacterium]|nr:M20/M25/M40 family metallo-hydrolase [Candidatus Saccharimonadales bacterium]
MTIEDTLAKLITFKTVSEDQAASKVALAWVKQQLKGLPLYLTDFEDGGFPALIITTQPTKSPRVWLQAHLDVVPGPDELFLPRTEGGKLVGRGAYDMKFALACYLQLFQTLGDRLTRYDFGVMITTDEELGGRHGAKAILGQGWRGETVVIPDSGEDWSFEVTAKGVLQLEVVSRGLAAHGSKPWEGQSAASRLVRFLGALEACFPPEPCGDLDHCHNSLTIGRLEGGEVVNQIMDKALAWLDIRLLPGTSKAEMEQLLRQVESETNAVEMREINYDSSYRVDTSNRYWQSFKRITEDHLKAEIVTTNSHGSTDARFFIERGIPAIVTRPRGGGHHSDHEWVDRSDLATFYRILEAFVQKTAVRRRQISRLT